MPLCVGAGREESICAADCTHLFFCPQKCTEIEKEMQDSRRQPEQWHPIPLSFEHILNHYSCLMKFLQSILQKPLEVRLKEGMHGRMQ